MDELSCGESYDHDADVYYDGPDGTQWSCRNCSAEGWEDPEPTTEEES